MLVDPVAELKRHPDTFRVPDGSVLRMQMLSVSDSMDEEPCREINCGSFRLANDEYKQPHVSKFSSRFIFFVLYVRGTDRKRTVIQTFRKRRTFTNYVLDHMLIAPIEIVMYCLPIRGNLRPSSSAKSRPNRFFSRTIYEGSQEAFAKFLKSC